MNLTYEITSGGYVIFNDGKAWIVQSDYIPYEGETLEVSAQNHIEALIEENSKVFTSISLEDEIKQLKESQADLWELILFGGGL